MMASEQVAIVVACQHFHRWSTGVPYVTPSHWATV